LTGSKLPALIAFSGVATAVTVAVALISWHVLEKQLLKLKNYFPYGAGTRTGVPASGTANV
jgi:peptidoglycan/LPS O-acetylase OafA/YrhL